MNLPPLLVVVGATAVGKSATAVLVARELEGEIVSADARQIYAGLEIGSGAPALELRRVVPHHLVGVAPLEPRLSAGDFARMAREVITGIIARGRLPMVVGGSGLYVRALVDGLAPTPPASSEVRREIENEIARRSMDALRDELAAADPDYAPLIGPHDGRRLVRALEVLRLTGKPFSAWHQSAQPAPWCSPQIFGLERPRSELHEIIARRVRGMIAVGWLEEVHGLIARYGAPEALPPAAREAVGYRQLADVIIGARDLETAVEATIIATRQFAKRQMTWFKADKRTEWLMQSGTEATRSWAMEVVRRQRCTPPPPRVRERCTPPPPRLRERDTPPPPPLAGGKKGGCSELSFPQASCKERT